VERPIDFSRDRHMLCGKCGHRWIVDLAWIDRWECSAEECPGCGVTCEEKTAPRVTVDPDDLTLDHDLVAQLAWYHTSTHPDWPPKVLDPAAGLTEDIRRVMGDDGAAQWAEKQ
jgi:hypothetical protein